MMVRGWALDISWQFITKLTFRDKQLYTNKRTGNLATSQPDLHVFRLREEAEDEEKQAKSTGEVRYQGITEELLTVKQHL